MIKTKKATNSSGLIFNTTEAIKFQALYWKQELMLDPSVTRYLGLSPKPTAALSWGSREGGVGGSFKSRFQFLTFAFHPVFSAYVTHRPPWCTRLKKRASLLTPISDPTSICRTAVPKGTGWVTRAPWPGITETNDSWDDGFNNCKVDTNLLQP